MGAHKKTITILIPCYNEESGIAATIQSFPKKKLAEMGYALDILVIDNNSQDKTASVAKTAGARVILEPRQGKGYAIRTGFYNITDDTDYVVMCDGDDTYKGHEILRLVEPLDINFAQVIIGSRLAGKVKSGSMKGLNRFGNWLFSFMVRVIYRVNVTDTLTGYFAWNRAVVIQLRQHLTSSGFGIEMEMITKMARMGYQIYSVPITYEPRLGDSSLRPIADGLRILGEFLRQLRWHPQNESVAFVSDSIYPYNNGGKEKRLHELSRRLVKSGRTVTIYTMKWWEGPNAIYTKDGVRLRAITKLHPLYVGERRSIAQALKFSFATLKLIKAKFDVVDVDSMPFFPLFSMRLVCLLKRKRLYATWHEVWDKNAWQEYLGGFAGSVALLVERSAMMMPSEIIANSEHTTQRLKEAGFKRPIHTIPLGVDIESILTIKPHEQVSDVIYVGRLLDNKNVNVLVRSLAILKEDFPKIQALIIGKGPEKAKLFALTAELGLEGNITYFDSVESHEELYSLIKASKMLVLPSVREGFGIVVAEAMACDIPTITTRHPLNAARHLIIEGKNGTLTDPDPDQLSVSIRDLLAGHMMNPLETFTSHFPYYQWQSAASRLEQVLLVGE